MNIGEEASSQDWCFYLEYNYLHAQSISWIIAPLPHKFKFCWQSFRKQENYNTYL